ncbi:hypothetical protein [Streptomyces cyaneofuscatus]|uniref:hypothetical protein n=1 Tax=Streptomyces cyaneofuscatus TaxID=66883 RepID=UPI003806EB7A
MSISALATDGSTHGFTMEVAADGKVTYDLVGTDTDSSTAGSDVPDVLSNASTTAADLSQESDSADADAVDAGAPEQTEVADVDSSAAAGACSDGAYSTDDHKEYGTYEWYIGDGGMPGGLSRDDARKAFWDAIDNITDSYNNCGYDDQVGARHHYRAPTSYELRGGHQQQNAVHSQGRTEHLGRRQPRSQRRGGDLRLDLAHARREERLA